MLPAYFHVFGVREDDFNTWWSWDDTSKYSTEVLKLPTVPILLRGSFANKDLFQEVVIKLSNLDSIYGDIREGIVARHVSELECGPMGMQLLGLGKYVREDFRSGMSKEHWMNNPVTIQRSLSS